MDVGPKDIIANFFAQAFAEKGIYIPANNQTGISPADMKVARESLDNGNALYTIALGEKLGNRIARIEVRHDQERGSLLNICRAVVAKFLELTEPKADTPAS